jgi:hypothetical protein
MTVKIRPSGGRWAGVDYVGASTVTLDAATETLMIGAGFAASTDVKQPNLPITPESLGADPVHGAAVRGAVRPNSQYGALQILPVPGSQALAGDVTNGKLLNSQIPAAGAFFGCRLIYLNYDTAAPMSIDGAKVAPVARTAGAAQSPANNTLSWSAFVTFGGSQSGSVPAAKAGAGGQTIPGVLVSDFVSVVSIPRTDTTSAPPLLRIATHIAASASSTSHPSFNSTGYTTLNQLPANPGFNFGNFSATVSLANIVSTTNVTYDIFGGAQNPIGAVFYYAENVVDAGAFGDSLFQGALTSSGYAGWPEYATWKGYAKSPKVAFANYATAAQKTVDTVQVLRSVLDQYKHKYAFFKAWSPNDGDTQAAYDQAWGYAIGAVEYCLSIGVTPVLVTSAPASGYTWSRIKGQNNRVMSLPTSVLKFDLAAVVNDPENDGSLVPAYTSDGTHYTDAGQSAIGGAALLLPL